MTLLESPPLLLFLIEAQGQKESHMGWWQRLIGRTRTARVDDTRFPVQLELLPGLLTARVHLHDIPSADGPVPCWSYVTHGFSAHQQKDLIFTLRRNPGEAAGDFPHDPLDCFVAIYRLAEQGRVVEAGVITEFAGPVFLGRKGVMYVRPEASQSVDRLQNVLGVILLSEEELAAARAFGPTRVMARLGDEAGYYPFPPWSDRARRGLPFASTLEQSILTHVRHRRWMTGARVRRVGKRIVLRLLPRVREPLHEYLVSTPADQAVALLTEFDPGADGCLVWQPGQAGLHAITPQHSDGSRLGGCFILFVPQQSADEGRSVEDGFAMMFNDASWGALRRAVEAGESLAISATEGSFDFSLEWIETAYHSSVDGAVYLVEDGWDTYHPRMSAAVDSAGPLKVEFVLLTAKQDFWARVATDAFVDYATAIKADVRHHLESIAPSGGQDLAARFEVWSDGRVSLRTAPDPGTTSDMPEGLYQSLLALPAPRVSQESIAFEILFKIRGGSARGHRE